jgi:hypothetical protein
MISAIGLFLAAWSSLARARFRGSSFWVTFGLPPRLPRAASKPAWVRSTSHIPLKLRHRPNNMKHEFPCRPIWPVHEKYNVKEYATRIERAGDQPRQVGQRGRVAEDKP